MSLPGSLPMAPSTPRGSKRAGISPEWLPRTVDGFRRRGWMMGADHMELTGIAYRLLTTGSYGSIHTLCDC